ncbi:MAG: hypoxanthine phosphoribosyltransferase [Oscillospiraceae bacterium]|nr:hypoxanthine phosphoribosyltransferase [Oscillospiraceae bacterium]
MMDQDIAYIMYTEQQLHERENELGKLLTKEYANRRPIFIGILRGVVVFYADMVRRIPIPCDFDFMSVTSYAGTTSSGRVKIDLDTRYDLLGRDVVILEDILDTGRTLKSVHDLLLQRHPASLKICALLDKPERRISDIEADWVGFTIPNEFVVGYGLDFNDSYRNLPYVGVLKPEIYEK